jgi:hypothetical protein
MDEEPDILGGLSSMLKRKQPGSGNDVIFRAGHKSDIVKGLEVNNEFCEATRAGHKTNAKQYWEPAGECNTYSDYSEQVFKRDFQDKLDENEEYDLDPRSVPSYNLVESEEMSVEDTAEAICSMQVFGARKKSYIWRIELQDEDPKTIDIDLRQDKFIMYSHKYKLRGWFNEAVNVESAKTKFFTDKHQLELRLRSL